MVESHFFNPARARPPQISVKYFPPNLARKCDRQCVFTFSIRHGVAYISNVTRRSNCLKLIFGHTFKNFI